MFSGTRTCTSTRATNRIRGDLGLRVFAREGWASSTTENAAALFIAAHGGQLLVRRSYSGSVISPLSKWLASRVKRRRRRSSVSGAGGWQPGWRWHRSDRRARAPGAPKLNTPTAAGMTNWSRLSVTHAVDERGYSVMLTIL